MSDLAKCMGVPLAGDFGHFARVIVSIDLASHLPNSILLNRKEGSVIINLFYENILDFCNAC